MHFSAIITAFFLTGLALADPIKKPSHARVRVLTWNIAAKTHSGAEKGSPWWTNACGFWLFRNRCRRTYAIDLINDIQQSGEASIISLQRTEYYELEGIKARLTEKYDYAGEQLKKQPTEQNDFLVPKNPLVGDFNPILYQTKHFALLNATSQRLSRIPKPGTWADSFKSINSITLALFQDLRTDNVFIVVNARFDKNRRNARKEMDVARNVIHDFRTTANQGPYKNAGVIFTASEWGAHYPEPNKRQGFQSAWKFDGSKNHPGPSETYTGWRLSEHELTEQILLGYNHEKEGQWFLRPSGSRVWENKSSKGPVLSDYRALHSDIDVGYT